MAVRSLKRFFNEVLLTDPGWEEFVEVLLSMYDENTFTEYFTAGDASVKINLGDSAIAAGIIESADPVMEGKPHLDKNWFFKPEIYDCKISIKPIINSVGSSFGYAYPAYFTINEKVTYEIYPSKTDTIILTVNDGYSLTDIQLDIASSANGIRFTYSPNYTNVLKTMLDSSGLRAIVNQSHLLGSDIKIINEFYDGTLGSSTFVFEKFAKLINVGKKFWVLDTSSDIDISRYYLRFSDATEVKISSFDKGLITLPSYLEERVDLVVKDALRTFSTSTMLNEAYVITNLSKAQVENMFPARAKILIN